MFCQVQIPPGVWGPPRETLEGDFRSTVAQLLGPGALATFDRATTPQEDGLLDYPPDEVLEGCSEIIGLDCRAEELRKAQIRKQRLSGRYGSSSGIGPTGLAAMREPVLVLEYDRKIGRRSTTD
jgi:hypothetical protein